MQETVTTNKRKQFQISSRTRTIVKPSRPGIRQSRHYRLLHVAGAWTNRVGTLQERAQAYSLKLYDWPNHHY